MAILSNRYKAHKSFLEKNAGIIGSVIGGGLKLAKNITRAPGAATQKVGLLASRAVGGTSAGARVAAGSARRAVSRTGSELARGSLGWRSAGLSSGKQRLLQTKFVNRRTAKYGETLKKQGITGRKYNTMLATENKRLSAPFKTSGSKTQVTVARNPASAPVNPSVTRKSGLRMQGPINRPPAKSVSNTSTKATTAKDIPVNAPEKPGLFDRYKSSMTGANQAGLKGEALDTARSATNTARIGTGIAGGAIAGGVAAKTLSSRDRPRQQNYAY